MLEMFVNELSLIPEAADLSSAHARAEQFVHTIRAATSRGVQRILHTPEDFLSRVLAPAYSWYNWFQDSRVERELRQYFLSLATKVPYLRDDSDAEARWR